MNIPLEHRDRIPQRIQDRLQALDSEVEAIISNAETNFKTTLPRKIAFDMSSISNTGDLITPYQRAQSISFVARYDHLPNDVKVHIAEQEGEWHIKNYWVLLHILDDFRPIIQNQKDSIYYTRIHSQWYPMLRRTDPNEGMIIRVLDDLENDFTDDYAKYVSENKKAIAAVLDQLEFGYLYNGILQHSDEQYSKRFLKEFSSGELNYVIWKHIRVLGLVKGLLSPYYRMVNVLTFPTLGAL